MLLGIKYEAARIGEVGEAALSGIEEQIKREVGDDWESMTPLTRADAIAAEADELPLEAPIAPLAG